MTDRREKAKHGINAALFNLERGHIASAMFQLSAAFKDLENELHENNAIPPMPPQPAPTNQLTKDEAQLVALLLLLYDVVWEAGRCKHGCECVVCKTAERAGNLANVTFNSLAAKAKAVMDGK